MRHLIHIGWPKAGSSWLQRWFASHPELAYRPGGIAGFDSVYDLAAVPAPDVRTRWRVTSEESFVLPRRRGLTMAADTEMADRATIETRQKDRCAVLAGLFPTAHILIVARGFRAMILSSYSQFVRTGGSTSLTDLMASAADSHPWNYDRVLALYRAAFPNRVIVLPFELLEENPAAFVAELERRLELSPHPFPQGRVNASLSPSQLAWYPRIARLLERLHAPRRIRRSYARASFDNRLDRPIAWLDRIFPAGPVTSAIVPDEYLERFRGEADLLGNEPLFRPYADSYMF